MKRMAEYKTVTYQYEGDVCVDIVTRPLKEGSDQLHYNAYLYRGYGRKVEMYGMLSKDTTKAAFVKEIEADVPEYLEYYDRTEEYMSEIPDDYYDDLDEKYGLLEYVDPDCCPYCSAIRVDENGWAKLEGSDKEVDLASEIRNKFFAYVRDNFKTEYKDSVEAFLRWVAAFHTESAWWIASEQNNNLYDMFIVLSMFEAWRRQ